MIPKEFIDNSNENKLYMFLNEILNNYPSTTIDIATAFFNIEAFSMIREGLKEISRFRLLIGKPPIINIDTTLGDFLLKQIKEEIENYDLTKEIDKNIKEFRDFLKKQIVEVKLFKNFLHGKAYIFDNCVIIGSSNFTSAGLTREGELNTVHLQAHADAVRSKWFNKYWELAEDFKEDLVKLIENSRFGNHEYTPYEIFIKTLYEFQKEELNKEEEEDKETGLPKTKVNLAEFQEDAIARIWSRLKKYNGCIVADSVGLGKTWIAKKILEKIGYYERKNILVICPAQLRDMWRRELKSIDVKENVLSQEQLAQNDFLEKVNDVLGGRMDDLELIVVDESHNFRNPLSNRWENLFILINDYLVKRNKRPKMLFLTATPINNTVWDLYWQIMLLVLNDNTAFITENILDLFTFFKKASFNPTVLNDLLNEISIRRTRDYIANNYPDAYIILQNSEGEMVEKKIIFPERVLENINYNLDKAYEGMYREISDTITERLKMAYYKILEYKKEGIRTEAEKMALGRMIGIGGIFKTILLKRLESSVEAFRISIERHIIFLENLKDYLKKGKLLTKNYFHKYILSIDEELTIDEVKKELEKFDVKQYNMERLLNDIDFDIVHLKKILNNVKKITPEKDAKLVVLKNKLLELSKEGQIVVFTYYADTLNYIYREILNDILFRHLNIEAISSSGETKKNSNQRNRIIDNFFKKKINILLSTDILSEGQNLQTAKFLINYDLHWNPTRMIQRAGRIDRIGSPYKEIYVYNFFPEEELEELLRLVEILQSKIIDIDNSIGLDQTVLGEEIHPKVFGIIRRIKDRDSTVLDDLEAETFGGGEKFYQPLKNYIKMSGIKKLEAIPYGVYSGLEKGKKVKGIFFYYKYGKDFHFWYLYDINNDKILTNKSEILEYIQCDQSETRVIPDFFEKVYEINQKILEKIENDYNEIRLSQTQDSKLKELSKRQATRFVKKIIDEIEIQLEDYLDKYPMDDEIEKQWEEIENSLIYTPHTKKGLQSLRKFWKKYKEDRNWKKLVSDLKKFFTDKGTFKKEPIEPFDKSKLKLITIDFVS
ncbi:MAG: helicase-related protein [Promethearchaeota archaeon]